VRETVKRVVFVCATLAVTPALVSYALRAAVFGRDRALEGSSQTLSLIPGLLGQYLRRAFYARVLDGFHPSVTIEFGTVLSKAGSRFDAHVYVGPGCHLGLVHLERDVLVGPGVHIPSGPATHGTADPDRPIREQAGVRTLVRVGAGSWIGCNAVVMADVGPDTVVAAGAVVTTPLPGQVIAGGVPARVLKPRAEAPVAPL
jgi:acetyltransferase-like isoleucine patch superfamily enzyme